MLTISSCECGHDFCYVCGKDWGDLHGCPHYGPAIYDEEGYNQDGFHRTTGLNRNGLTRLQDLALARGEEDRDDGDDDEQDEDPDWDVLRHLTPDQRMTINVLEGADREDALDQHRIELMETRGILFNQHQPHLQANNVEDDEDHSDTGGDDTQDEAAGNNRHGEGNLEPDNERDGDNDLGADSDHEVNHETLQRDRFADEHMEINILNVDNENVGQLPVIDEGLEFMLLAELDSNSANTPPQQDEDESENSNVDSNASYVGSVAHGRFVNGVSLRPQTNEAEHHDPTYDEDSHESLEIGKAYHSDYLEANGIDPLTYAEGRASSSGESDDIRPATPMDIDESAENRKGLGQGEQQSQVQVLDAWHDDVLL